MKQVIDALQLQRLRSRAGYASHDPITEVWFKAYMKLNPDHVQITDGPQIKRIKMKHKVEYLIYIDRRWIRHKARKERMVVAARNRGVEFFKNFTKVYVSKPNVERELFYHGRTKHRLTTLSVYHSEVFDLWEAQEGWDVRGTVPFPVEFCAFAEAYLLEMECRILDGRCTKIKKKLQEDVDARLEEVSKRYDLWIKQAEAKGAKGVAYLEANLKRGLLKKRASLEYAAFQKYYRETFGDMIKRNRKKNKSKGQQKRRDLLRVSVDNKVRQKIRQIHIGPCKCHWCNAWLPDGGEADHITPLTKVGKHVSSNIVPSCAACNQKKSGDLPSILNVDAPELPLL